MDYWRGIFSILFLKKTLLMYFVTFRFIYFCKYIISCLGYNGNISIQEKEIISITVRSYFPNINAKVPQKPPPRNLRSLVLGWGRISFHVSRYRSSAPISSWSASLNKFSGWYSCFGPATLGPHLSDEKNVIIGRFRGESETVFVEPALMKVHSSLYPTRSRYLPYKLNAFHRSSIKPCGSRKNGHGGYDLD